MKDIDRRYNDKVWKERRIIQKQEEERLAKMNVKFFLPTWDDSRHERLCNGIATLIDCHDYIAYLLRSIEQIKLVPIPDKYRKSWHDLQDTAAPDHDKDGKCFNNGNY